MKSSELALPSPPIKFSVNRAWFLAAVVFLVGAGVALAYRPFSQAARGDPPIYDYIAQTILRGQMPYRDVVDIKWPGAPYLSGVAMFAGRMFGIEDILAVRALNVLLVGVLCAVTFLVADAYLKDRFAAVFAALVPLMVPQFLLMMSGGTQPKLPMMIFGMASLLMIARDWPFFAGFMAMLSCLCWQPALLFAGVAGLIFSRYLTSWRDLRAIKVIAGAAVPLAVMLLYFWYRGALDDLWSWTITYNYTTFGPEGERPLGEQLNHIRQITRRVFERDVWLIAIAAIGMVIFAVQRVRAKAKGREAIRWPAVYKDALLIPPVVYFAFCLVNFQGAPDLIPFFSFIGIFAAWALVEIARVISARPGLSRVRILIFVIAFAGLALFITTRSVRYRVETRTLQSQREEARLIDSYLEPGETIYVHGAVELLVLMKRPNANPYIALDFGADDYIASRMPDGFNGILREIESANPKIVAITRLRKVNHRDELERWVEERYERLELPTYGRIYIRKARDSH